MKINFDCDVYPWVEDDKLIFDVTVDGDNWESESVKLTNLFGEFMEARRVYGTNQIGLSHQQEVSSMIALLRFIAREMETELHGSRDGTV